MSKPDLSKLMEAAQEMQKTMKATQERLDQIEVTGEAGGGLVKITVDGRRRPRKTELDPAILQESLQVIETLITGALNDAMKKAEEKIETQMMDIAKEFKLPTDLSEKSSDDD